MFLKLGSIPVWCYAIVGQRLHSRRQGPGQTTTTVAIYVYMHACLEVLLL